MDKKKQKHPTTLYPKLMLFLYVLTLTNGGVLGGITDTNRKWKDGPTGGPDKTLVRGVPTSKAAFYDPTKPKFECFDGSDNIDFKKVNDDYCDCNDGSDEPGTTACNNGYFYCNNKGYKGYFIPSGWVNDSVCDCCDGSDEYMSSFILCRDNCNDLAQLEQEETEKNAKVYREGGKIRDELIEKAKNVKTDIQEKLSKIRAEHAEAERIKKEMENLKVLAEDREKKALEKYKPPEHQSESDDHKTDGEAYPDDDRVREESNEESVNIAEDEAVDYFNNFDSDKDGMVTMAELQTRAMFDKNHDGEVSMEEALYLLGNREQVNKEEFIAFAWPYIKPFVMKNAGVFKPPQSEEIEDEGDNEQEELEEPGHEIREEEEDFEEQSVHQEEYTKESGEVETLSNIELESQVNVEENTPKDEEKKTPEYDEETLAIIDEAKNAREKYQESERAVNDLLHEIRQYEERSERDYGPKNEYAPLDGQCFEYETKEYVYSLCLFGKATQRSVSGGGEVSLGQWNSWIGGEEDHKYTKAKYDRGLTCWNGPARSTIVTLLCSTGNAILSVSEPNRCEYAMELATPAACNMKIIEKKYDFHDSSTWRDNHDEL